MIVTGSHYQREWGIGISAGQVDAWLSGKYEPFHEEKDAKLLPSKMSRPISNIAVHVSRTISKCYSLM
jgi:hypothetical protein